MGTYFRLSHLSTLGQKKAIARNTPVCISGLRVFQCACMAVFSAGHLRQSLPNESFPFLVYWLLKQCHWCLDISVRGSWLGQGDGQSWQRLTVFCKAYLKRQSYMQCMLNSVRAFQRKNYPKTFFVFFSFCFMIYRKTKIGKLPFRRQYAVNLTKTHSLHSWKFQASSAQMSGEAARKIGQKQQETVEVFFSRQFSQFFPLLLNKPPAMRAIKLTSKNPQVANSRSIHPNDQTSLRSSYLNNVKNNRTF